jgi:hypothetical protein
MLKRRRPGYELVMVMTLNSDVIVEIYGAEEYLRVPDGPRGRLVADRARETVIRIGLHRIIKGLHNRSFPPDATKLHEILVDPHSFDDWPRLEESRLFTEKVCDFQVDDPKGLECTASGLEDPMFLKRTGSDFVALTTRAMCRECSLPNSDLVCDSLVHPLVMGDMDTRTRGLVRAFCDRGIDLAESAPSRCHAGGHGCWEMEIDVDDESDTAKTEAE